MLEASEDAVSGSLLDPVRSVQVENLPIARIGSRTVQRLGGERHLAEQFRHGGVVEVRQGSAGIAGAQVREKEVPEPSIEGGGLELVEHGWVAVSAHIGELGVEGLLAREDDLVHEMSYGLADPQSLLAEFVRHCCLPRRRASDEPVAGRW
jgi:hypothetical protein